MRLRVLVGAVEYWRSAADRVGAGEPGIIADVDPQPDGMSLVPGISVNQVFTPRRLMNQGALTDATAGEEVVLESGYGNHRNPSQRLVFLVFQHHRHRLFTHPRQELVCPLADSGSIF